MSRFLSVIKIFLNHTYFLALIVLACFYTQITESDRYYGWTNSENTLPEHTLTIDSDGSGYYAYLPQWFIYSDSPHFSFLTKICKKYKTDKFTSGLHISGDQGTSKYFIGTPICISPFFLMNHFLNKLKGVNSDGYSKDFQLSVSISALFYSLFGIIGLIKLLKLFNLSNSIIALMVVFTSVGTSVNFYASFNPAFSHIYSFCAITWFLYYSKKWVSTSQSKYVIYLGFLLGLIFLIRPTNIFIVLIIPFLFNNYLGFKIALIELVKNNKSKILTAIFLFLGLVFLQVYNVYSQIGQWTLNTYSNEHFDYLLSPKWFEVLFGYGKGFFVYNPILILLLPAIVWGLIKRTYLTIGFLLFFLVIIYLTSSWWCWWYGGGLGMRPFVDFTSLFILMIALFYNSTHSVVKSFVLLYAVCMIYFYQILQIQFNKNILHYDLMTKDKFWSIFLKTDNRFCWMTHFEEFEIKGKHKSQVVKFQPYEFTMSFESKVNNLIFKPQKDWSNTHFGLRFKGELFLTNPESNTCLKLSFFKNGLVIKQVDQFVGNRINELNEYYAFSKDYIDTIRYKYIDSIKLTIPNGYPIVKAKNLKCIFYSLD